jgi:hypothetical protein
MPKNRWKIMRMNRSKQPLPYGWRLIVRNDRPLQIYQAFFCTGCILIVLRRGVQQPLAGHSSGRWIA